MSEAEGLAQRLQGLLAKWRAKVDEGLAPTDRIIGWEMCADELETALGASRVLAPESPHCPCCGSEKIAPTAGNGVGNTHDCVVCHTDFTPPASGGEEVLPVVVQQYLARLDCVMVTRREWEGLRKDNERLRARVGQERDQ